MDRRAEIREFLVTRRARVTPEQAGIVTYGELRRVPGLRREEVARLAGVSIDYYTRLERGSVNGVSEQVLHAVASALQLDEAERTHLLDLYRSSAPAANRSRSRPSQQRVRPAMQRLLDAMPGVAAVIQNGRLDILAANPLGRAVYIDKFDGIGINGLDAQGRLPNHARYTFLDSRAADFYADWAQAASTGVSLLRAEAGRNPEDRALNELIGELCTRSAHFAQLWAAHDVRIHTSGTKHFHHRVAGDLTLHYETLQLPGDPGQSLLAYTAEPGTPSSDALDFLASWATSANQPDDMSASARMTH